MITSDILLADSRLKSGATLIATTGKLFTPLRLPAPPRS
ncbi:MAG: hypothetical protein R3E21_00875 [Caenibius sp.]